MRKSPKSTAGQPPKRFISDMPTSHYPSSNKAAGKANTNTSGTTFNIPPPLQTVQSPASLAIDKMRKESEAMVEKILLGTATQLTEMNNALTSQAAHTKQIEQVQAVSEVASKAALEATNKAMAAVLTQISSKLKKQMLTFCPQNQHAPKPIAQTKKDTGSQKQWLEHPDLQFFQQPRSIQRCTDYV